MATKVFCAASAANCKSNMIPAWFLRVLAPICSVWLAQLFNIFLRFSWVPPKWKISIIHPIPKVTPLPVCNWLLPNIRRANTLEGPGKAGGKRLSLPSLPITCYGWNATGPICVPFDQLNDVCPHRPIVKSQQHAAATRIYSPLYCGVFIKPLTVSYINLSLKRWSVSSCRITFIGWGAILSLVAMLLNFEISSLQLHSSTLQSFRGQMSDLHRTLSLPPIFVRAIRKWWNIRTIPTCWFVLQWSTL